MRFSGYWVTLSPEKATLQQTSFDDTELDPATNWKEAWQNQDEDAKVKGFIDFRSALFFAASHLAELEHRKIDQLLKEKIDCFLPTWTEEKFVLSCLDDFL